MFDFLFYVAIIAEAMTAALSAGRRDMDWFGVCIIAWVTALGGGTLRNVLIGHYPMTWIAHPEYLVITVVAALSAGLLAKFMHRLKRVFMVLDAVGLMVFTIAGMQVAQEQHLPVLIVLICGLITGISGGVFRDMLCNEIPLLFRKEIYASASILTGVVYLTLEHFGVMLQLVILISSLAGFALRMLSIRYNWEMPKFVYRDDWS